MAKKQKNPRQPKPPKDTIKLEDGSELSITTVKKLYNTDKLSWGEIAKQYNTYPNKLARFAKRHGVKNRSRSESQAILFEQGKKESPTKGKKRSNAVKEKISKTQSDTWNKFTDEQHAERCQMSKEAWDKKTPDEIASLKAAAVRGVLEAAEKGSKIENFIQDKLREAGYLIETHKEDLLHGAKTHIDIFIPEMQTAVEIDGPAHFLPIWGQEKLDHHIRKDNTKNSQLIGAGFTVVRVKYMLSSSSLAKMRYASEEVLKRLKLIKDEPETYNNKLIEIEVK
jgi:hypothetical protein